VNDPDPLALLRAARERAERMTDDPPPGGTGPIDPPATDRAATVPGTVPDHLDAPEPDLHDVGPEAVAVADDRPRSALDGVEATGARRRRRRQSATRNLVEWLVVVAGALIVALVVKTWLFQAFYIPSGSMEPTLHIDDRVLVNKISYDLEDVDRGDIIVFERPESWGTSEIDDLIKRVVGLPGETISVVDGEVLIDGEVLDEPWLEDDVTTPGFFEESGCVPECTIPDDAVFVLGDNRSNSDASNHFGSLPFEQVVGRAFLRVWPLGSFGTL
jgi:signal peptidase I